MHEGALGYRVGRVARHVPDYDPPAGALFDVDVVYACASLAYQLQFRRVVQENRIHPYLIDYHYFAVAAPGQGLLPAAVRIANEFPLLGNSCHRGVAHSGGIKKNYLHIIKFQKSSSRPGI